MHCSQRRSMGSVVSLDCAAMVVVVEVVGKSATRGRFGAANRAHGTASAALGSLKLVVVVELVMRVLYLMAKVLY